MNLKQRVITLNFTKAELDKINAIEEEVLEPIIIPVEYETGVKLDTRFYNYKWTVPSKLSIAKNRQSYCVTGRFLYGTRKPVGNLIRNFAYDDQIIVSQYTNLIVAKTTGEAKIQRALYLRSPIYCELDFYNALIEYHERFGSYGYASNQNNISVTDIEKIKGLRKNAVTQQQMYENYIKPSI